MDHKILRQTDEDVVILPGARVSGDVTMGHGCSVWYNAVIRGDEALLPSERTPIFRTTAPSTPAMGIPSRWAAESLWAITPFSTAVPWRTTA